MTKKEIEQMRAIQKAFREDRISFSNADLHSPDEENHEQPYRDENTIESFIQNEGNAYHFYEILSSKAGGKAAEVIKTMASNAKQRETNLNNIYTKQNGNAYNKRNPNINGNISLKNGLLWAIEVENSCIHQMLLYHNKSSIDSIIQSKICDIHLLYLALYHI